MVFKRNNGKSNKSYSVTNRSLEKSIYSLRGLKVLGVCDVGGRGWGWEKGVKFDGSRAPWGPQVRVHRYMATHASLTFGIF